MSRLLYAVRLRHLFSIFFFLCLLSGSCGDDRPAVLLTLLGVDSRMVGVRVHATLNGSKAMAPQEYREGFGQSVVEFSFAVKLPPGARGSLQLEVTALTQENCHMAKGDEADLRIDLGDSPPAVTRRTITLKQYDMPMCPLEIEKQGGPGTVTWQPPISCTDGNCLCVDRCAPVFPLGTVVTLEPAANLTTALSRWEGACTGKGPCRITMDGKKNVSAIFAPTLTVNRRWAGGLLENVKITSKNGVIDCGSKCTAGFDVDTVVTLKNESTPPACFVRWGGACSGSGDCVTTIKDAAEVDAYFADCRAEASGVTDSLSDVFATSASDVWAVAPSNRYVHRDASGWSAFPSPDPMTGRPLSVWAYGPTADVWIGAYDNIHRLVRPSSWTSIQNGAYYYMNEVWGDAVNSIWFVSDRGRVYHSSGTTPDKEWSFSNPLYGLWGIGYNDIWAVGGNSSIYHWDGALWTQSANVPGDGSTLIGIWAASSNRAWTVGAKGLILKWNGAEWLRENNPVVGINLHDVWGVSEKDVWAVGESSTILHYDGNSWVKVSFPGSASLTYFAVHGRDEKDFWIVGESGTILHYKR